MVKGKRFPRYWAVRLACCYGRDYLIVMTARRLELSDSFLPRRYPAFYPAPLDYI